MRQALALCRDLGDRLQQAQVLTELAAVQRLTGDYPAATASSQQALSLYRDLRHSSEAAHALNELGLVQQLTGDYPAAAASHQQALELYRDTGNRLGQAETLNCLGELASRTADGRQARDHHAQALAIARDLGTPPEEARALEGIGHSHLRDGNPTQAAAPLRDALAIYQRIGSPAARRVEETLRQHGLSPASAHPAPDQESAGQRRRSPDGSQPGTKQHSYRQIQLHNVHSERSRSGHLTGKQPIISAARRAFSPSCAIAQDDAAGRRSSRRCRVALP